jgi:hypothetical protein
MNGDKTDGPEERTDQEVTSEKPRLRKWVGVNIKLTDKHYLVSFNHNDPPRVFHNIQQLLTAIEVECDKLGPGPTQT